MTLRRIVFWLHLTAGVSAGTVILIMSVTGFLLAYQKQIVALADRGFREEVIPASSNPLSTAALAAKVRDVEGTLPSALTYYASSRTAAATVGANTFYIDVYSGTIRGSASTRVRDFFQSVTNWHRYLAMAGDKRNTGRTITGVSNFVFLFIVLSGMFIWFPRGGWNRQAIRAIVWFRSGLRGRARNWNWHHTFGFLAAIPLLFIVASGVVMSFPWANDLVYRLSGDTPPAPGGQAGGRDGGGERGGQRGQSNSAAAVFDFSGVDAAVATAELQVPGWKSINFRLPNRAGTPLSLAIDRGNGGQPQLRSTMVIDRRNGQVMHWDKFEDQSAGRRTRSWLRFVHTGEYYGIIGQTVAAFAAFAAVMLASTGFLLVRRRLLSWLGKRKRTPTFAPAGSNTEDMA